MTVLLGFPGRNSWKEYYDHFIETGIRVGDFADILKKIPIAPSIRPVRLASFSVRDLGFTDFVRYGAVRARVLERGYRLCPPEVGPALRWVYRRQPMHEWRVVCMTAVLDRVGTPRAFQVGHGDAGLWLGARFAGEDARFTPDDLLIGMLP